MRLFFAIPLQDQLKQHIQDKMPLLDRNFPRGTWVKPENMHITLLFLGEVEKSLVPELRESAIFLAKQFKADSLVVNELGAFPSKKVVKTLFYALNHQEWLENLGYDLRKNMFAFGINDNKGFHPHITLSRFRVPVKVNPRFNWNMHQIDHHFEVDRFELIESKLSARGPAYRTVAKFYLNKEE